MNAKVIQDCGRAIKMFGFRAKLFRESEHFFLLYRQYLKVMCALSNLVQVTTSSAWQCFLQLMKRKPVLPLERKRLLLEVCRRIKC